MVVDNYRMLEACLYRGAASEFKVRSYFYSRSKGMMSLYQECLGRECANYKLDALRNVNVSGLLGVYLVDLVESSLDRCACPPSCCTSK